MTKMIIIIIHMQVKCQRTSFCKFELFQHIWSWSRTVSKSISFFLFNSSYNNLFLLHLWNFFVRMSKYKILYWEMFISIQVWMIRDYIQILTIFSIAIIVFIFIQLDWSATKEYAFARDLAVVELDISFSFNSSSIKPICLYKSFRKCRFIDMEKSIKFT